MLVDVLEEEVLLGDQGAEEGVAEILGVGPG